MCTFPRTKDNSNEEERSFTPAADYTYLPDSYNALPRNWDLFKSGSCFYLWFLQHSYSPHTCIVVAAIRIISAKMNSHIYFRTDAAFLLPAGFYSISTN